MPLCRVRCPVSETKEAGVQKIASVTEFSFPGTRRMSAVNYETKCSLGSRMASAGLRLTTPHIPAACDWQTSSMDDPLVHACIAGQLGRRRTTPSQTCYT